MTSYDKVSIENISFTTPEKSDVEGFGHLSSLKTDLGEVTLPELKLYSSGVYEKDGFNYVDLLLGRSDKLLYLFMNKLDTHCLEMVHKNSEEWYGDTVSLDVLETYYTRIIRSENNLPIFRLMVNDDVRVVNADEEPIELSDLKKNMKTTLSLRVNGLRIEEENICLNLVAHTLRTATKSKSKKTKTTTVEETVETAAETTAETATESAAEKVVENIKETVEVVPEETLESNTQKEETDEVAEETTTTPLEENVEVSIENTKTVEKEPDTVSVSSRTSRSSRRSRMSSRTAMSSQLSEQMDLVKKMHREAVRAERYANKKRLEAVRAVHELRNLELSEMSSNYNSYNLNDDVSEFIETASYLDA